MEQRETSNLIYSRKVRQAIALVVIMLITVIVFNVKQFIQQHKRTDADPAQSAVSIKRT